MPKRADDVVECLYCPPFVDPGSKKLREIQINVKPTRISYLLRNHFFVF